MHISGIGLTAPFGGLPELKHALTEDAFQQAETLQADTTELASFVSPRKLRRVDHFTSMTLLAAYRALADAGYGAAAPDNMGIVLSSGFGPAETTFDFLDSILDHGAGCASPLAFSHSVHNIPAAMLAMFLGSPCPCTTICQPYRPVSTGLLTAQAWLEEGRVDAVLFGAVDEATPLLTHVSGRIGTPRLGEGAAFFMLGRTEGRHGRVQQSQDGASASGPEALVDSLCGYLPVKSAFRLAAAAVVARQSGTAKCREQGITLSVEIP